MSAMKIDLHVHTEFSKDSNTPLRRVVREAERKELDGIAVTDHDTVEGFKRIKDMDHDLHIIPGIEITTDEGELLGLFVEKEIKKRCAEEVVDEVHRRGGLVIVPHPFDPFRGFKSWKQLDFDGIETFNSRNLLGAMNRKAENYAEEVGCMRSAGSDAHTAWEIGKAYVKADAENIDEFKKRFEEQDVEIHGIKSSPTSYILGNFEKLKYKLLTDE